MIDTVDAILKNYSDDYFYEEKDIIEFEAHTVFSDPFVLKKFGKLDDRKKLAFLLVNLVGVDVRTASTVLGCNNKEVLLELKKAKKYINEFIGDKND